MHPHSFLLEILTDTAVGSSESRSAFTTEPVHPIHTDSSIVAARRCEDNEVNGRKRHLHPSDWHNTSSIHAWKRKGRKKGGREEWKRRGRRGMWERLIAFINTSTFQMQMPPVAPCWEPHPLLPPQLPNPLLPGQRWRKARGQSGLGEKEPVHPLLPSPLGVLF